LEIKIFFNSSLMVHRDTSEYNRIWNYAKYFVFILENSLWKIRVAKRWEFKLGTSTSLRMAQLNETLHLHYITEYSMNLIPGNNLDLLYWPWLSQPILFLNLSMQFVHTDLRNMIYIRMSISSLTDYCKTYVYVIRYEKCSISVKGFPE